MEKLSHCLFVIILCLNIMVDGAPFNRKRCPIATFPLQKQPEDLDCKYGESVDDNGGGDDDDDNDGDNDDIDEDIDGRCDELLRNIWRGGYRATSIIGVATSATWSHARAMTMMRMTMATITLAMMRNEDGNDK